MDVMQVRRAMQDSMERARKGQPCLIEAITYRYRGHSVADAARYRTPEEVQAWRDQDPIERFYRQLEVAGLIDEKERQEIQAEVNQTVDDAVQFAEKSPEPDPAGLLDYLYVDPPANV
jgi:pyruvate dehydrogenase E1 component alpha subunit